MCAHTLGCCAPALLRHKVPGDSAPFLPGTLQEAAQRLGGVCLADLQFNKSFATSSGRLVEVALDSAPDFISIQLEPARAGPALLARGHWLASPLDQKIIILIISKA